jgi:hypothetical protein
MLGCKVHRILVYKIYGYCQEYKESEECIYLVVGEKTVASEKGLVDIGKETHISPPVNEYKFILSQGD